MRSSETRLHRALRLQAWLHLLAPQALLLLSLTLTHAPLPDSDLLLLLGTAFAALRWPALFVALVGALLALALREPKHALCGLPIFAVMLPTALWPASGEALESRGISLVSANLHLIHPDPEAAAQELADLDAEVYVFQEVTARWRSALEARFAGSHPHQLWAPREDAFGIGLVSRLPLQDPRILGLGALRVPAVTAGIELDGRPCALVGAHLLPPRRLSYVAEIRRELADLRALLEAERLILAGDFNAPVGGPVDRALRGMGLRDAHEVAGAGRGATWPARGASAWLPGLRLDRVWVRGLEVGGCEVAPAFGSDHRPLRARVGAGG